MADSREDYYALLGVSKTSTPDEISSAHKKLARQHHPDKGGDQKLFTQIQTAYEVLSDPVKRAEYDNPNPFAGATPFPSRFQDFHDFGSDVVIELQISLRDVYYGKTVTHRLQRKIRCVNCMISCSSCAGKGFVVKTVVMGPFSQILQSPCNSCSAKGHTFPGPTVDCSACRRLRFKVEEKNLEIKIAPGLQDGVSCSVADWGLQKPNGSFGKAVILIKSKPDPDFTRKGFDLHFKVKLPFADSVCGTRLYVPLFEDGFNVDVRKLGIIDPRRDYFVANKGLTDVSGKRGSVVLSFDIVYPPEALAADVCDNIRVILDGKA